jgi:hypothetical protein
MGEDAKHSPFFIFMKYKVILVSFSILFINYLSSQTEIASYGFKGKVKSVKYSIYNEASFDSFGKYIDEKRRPFIEKTLFFDKKGNIDSVVEVLAEGRFFEKYITYHVHTGNRIKSTIKYRYYTNEVMEEVKFTWSQKNTRCDFRGLGFSTFTKGYRLLSYNYRESKGEYMQETKKGEVLLKESYKNEFDGKWNLTRTFYNNASKGMYNIVYEYDEMDEVGNYSEVKLFYEDSRKLQRFIKKEFNYY